MMITLDPVTEERLERELARGRFSSPAELIAHALELVSVEDDWLLQNRDAVNAMLDVSFAQAVQGGSYSPDEALAVLNERRTSRAG